MNIVYTLKKPITQSALKLQVSGGVTGDGFLLMGAVLCQRSQFKDCYSCLASNEYNTMVAVWQKN